MSGFALLKIGCRKSSNFLLPACHTLLALRKAFIALVPPIDSTLVSMSELIDPYNCFNNPCSLVPIKDISEILLPIFDRISLFLGKTFYRHFF